MAIPRLIALGVGAVALVAVLLVATLLVAYRPSIEYAYVDIIDPRKDVGLDLWAMTAGAIGVAVLVAVILARRSRRASRQSGDA